ncbi:DUF6886 family protein [Heyndrickxia sp. NPDC080065]|uniref:DUF6886 family protein n=1 Tax=Heyndrickxia sp. NPDC080065 TaxID=3390568 RepID=UPI003CFDE519
MLYHFSEESDIQVFKPRPSMAHPKLDPAVWAIDEEHALHYYFPRDCPRVIYWKADWTSKSDICEFFSDSKVDKIIVVENRWLERIRNKKLYVYTFPEDTFKLFEEAKTAGYHVSHEEVVPIKVELVDDLIAKILSKNVELRFTPDLHIIRDRVLSSTVDFSIIRFRNAIKQ